MVHVRDIIRSDESLIDNIFLEFTDIVALPFNQVLFVETMSEEETGDFGRVSVSIGVNVICAEGFNGSDCSTLCEDVNGILVCEEGRILPNSLP